MEFLWEQFQKSGSVEAYLGYKETERTENRDFRYQNHQLRVGKQEPCR